MEDMLEGFGALYPQYVHLVSGGVVRSAKSKAGKVAVVVGGGSGHYPAFCGVVGPGFADGAVVGNIFTSPSGEDAYNVGKASSQGGGIFFITGNYAGDVLNFNQAQARLISEGFAVRNLYVTDDVASAPVDEITKRRGIAGDFTVFRVAGAAAEEGLNLGQVEALAIRANRVTRTLGVAFAGCTLPGADKPLFTVPKGKMGLGLGIHGEPGISEDALPTAAQLANILVDGVLAEFASEKSKRIAVILNGLGATKYEELFVVWKSVSTLLDDRGYSIVQPEVGELVTSLDMAGCSLTIMLLDEDLERLWCSPTDTPSYRKGVANFATEARKDFKSSPSSSQSDVVLDASDSSRMLAQQASEVFGAVHKAMEEAEEELGRIDAVAGDGDHGRGMVKGTAAAKDAALDIVSRGGGIAALFNAAGDAWAAKAGGTSGVLWGTALKEVGQSLSSNGEILSSRNIAAAVAAGVKAIASMGKAEIGDKTMLDAMVPFARVLTEAANRGDSIGVAWAKACALASQAAIDTAPLRPKIGRARPLADRSVGTPDAGAISFAKVMVVIRDYVWQG